MHAYIFLDCIWSSTSELQALLDSDHYHVRFEAGVSPPSLIFVIDDKNRNAVDLAKHFIIYSSKAELDQLQCGLETLDAFLKKHAGFIKPLFAWCSGRMRTSWRVQWSHDA